MYCALCNIVHAAPYHNFHPLAGFTVTEEYEEGSPRVVQGRRHLLKSCNRVAPQHHGEGGSSSASSSANGDGASLNGTSSTASVGTPEITRSSTAHGSVDTALQSWCYSR